MTRKRSLIAFGFAVLAVLLGLYVGAYYALVKPVPIFDDNGNPSEKIYWYPLLSRFGDEYGMYEGLFWFFEPAHQLDHRLRPHFWDPSQ